jgi:hypothetical protein
MRSLTFGAAAARGAHDPYVLGQRPLQRHLGTRRNGIDDVLADKSRDAPWRRALGIVQPSTELTKAIDFLGQVARFTTGDAKQSDRSNDARG